MLGVTGVGAESRTFHSSRILGQNNPIRNPTEIELRYSLRFPWIGGKIAKRFILELKEKMKAIESDAWVGDPDCGVPVPMK